MRLAILLILLFTSINFGWSQSQNNQRSETFKNQDPSGRSLSNGIQKLADNHLELKKYIEKDALKQLESILDDSYHDHTINMVQSRDYLRLTMDMMINKNALYWKALIANDKDAHMLLLARICWHTLDDEIEKGYRLCQLASSLIPSSSPLSSLRQSISTRLSRLVEQRNKMIQMITLQRNKGNKFDAELALNALQRQFVNSPQLLFTAYQLKLTEYDIDQAEDIMMNWSICTDTVLKTDRLFPINFPATTLNKLYEVTIRSQINEMVKTEQLNNEDLARIALEALEMNAADFAAHIFYFLQSGNSKKADSKEYRHHLYYCLAEMGVIHAFSNKESINAQNKFEKIKQVIDRQKYTHDIFSSKTMAGNKRKR